jgi:L-cysteine S-thiosulfotransferase
MNAMKNNLSRLLQLSLISVSIVFSCCVHAETNLDAQFQKMISSSFRSEGIASVDRLRQDQTQKFCSGPPTTEDKKSIQKAEEIQKINLAMIIEPADGRYLGDWKRGEAIAQSGRGSTWSDKPQTVNGGGCYNCHQIDIKEIAYGNLGPSLWNYGKLRGYSSEVVIYTWRKIFNPKAFNACSAMPRFGHFKLLTQEQIQDVMALLLDPSSPINQ